MGEKINGLEGVPVVVEYGDEISTSWIDRNGERHFKYWDNHHTTDKELKLLDSWVKYLLDTFDHNINGNDGIELKECEKKLNIALPLDMKIVYEHFGKDDKFLTNKHYKHRVLSLNQLYLSNNRLVFMNKGKKPLWGIDLEKNRLDYFGNEWFWDKDAMPLHKVLIVGLFIDRISNMENVVYSRLKVKSSTRLVEETKEKFINYLFPLTGFDWYEHMLFYNKEQKALAWVRPLSSGGADILVGCDDLSYLEKFINEFSLKAKYRVKNNESTK